jgi:hypothetical protein
VLVWSEASLGAKSAELKARDSDCFLKHTRESVCALRLYSEPRQNGCETQAEEHICLVTNMELRDVIEQIEYLQKPKNNGDYNHCVQDALDRSLHGNEAVNQP